MYAQVTVLNDRDIQTVKSLYDEAVRLGQHNVILTLQSRLVKILGGEPEEKPIDFVSQVIKDYNYYTQNM